VGNASVLFHLLHRSDCEIPPALAETQEYIRAVLAPLSRAQMARPDAALIRDEFTNAARMLQHACARGLAASRPDLATQMREILAEHRRLWLARNRPGGLTDSTRVLEQRLHEYETATARVETRGTG
jgi:hypothetical protein